MLNIRINFTIDVRKTLRVIGACMLMWVQLLQPANALPAPVSNEKQVKVSLQYLTVKTTRSDAKKALASAYVKYFDPQTIAFLTEYAKGKSMAEWKCLNSLWQSESHFNPKALNMSSHAFGIAQFLPTTWSNYKITKTPSAQLQIKYGLRYIKVRYGTACQAQNFHLAHGWY